MTAYYANKVSTFLQESGESLTGQLLLSQDEVPAQQKESWLAQVEILNCAFNGIKEKGLDISAWGILFEYRMLRIERRIDVVLLAGDIIFSIEFKINGQEYNSSDRLQAENYALDLKDFHSGSQSNFIVPILCSSAAKEVEYKALKIKNGVTNLVLCNSDNLASSIYSAIEQLSNSAKSNLKVEEWNTSPYCPVPSIIEAAQDLYASNDVREIHTALSEKTNLTKTTDKLIELINNASEKKEHLVCFVTGVPGSGKTLTGLNAIHDPRLKESRSEHGAFLSGNTPLIAVLREALSKDEHKRVGGRIADIRSNMRSKIQNLMRFLEQYLDADTSNAPADHVVIFDEAQRAWDENYGKQKFNREDSEPAIFLSIMNRHQDWSVIIALVGGGQEINSGEGGIALWGEAIAKNNQDESDPKWKVCASPHVIEGSTVTAGGVLFSEGIPSNVEVELEESLHLPVSIRSHRCELANSWIDAVLEGRPEEAKAIAEELDDFPIYLTRSLDDLKRWLKTNTRGYRRCGLLASSEAKRLRGYGLGVSLSAQELPAVVNYYLEDREDVRSSYSLEITANEYASQGLELDLVGLCWGGDLTWDKQKGSWRIKRFLGNKWSNVGKQDRREYMLNTYRVLLSRSREAMVVWVPPGDSQDNTRPVGIMDDTAEYFENCGLENIS